MKRNITDTIWKDWEQTCEKLKKYETTLKRVVLTTDKKLLYQAEYNRKCICVIDGAQHEIYNVAHVTTKDGFKETELTLKTPAYDREVYDDETGT